ncbi:MAG TPA: hypothetical protein VF379_01600 [Gaiellaceae bacterium]
MGARPFLVVAVIAVVVPAAALPQGQLPKGAPIRTAVALPDDGNASASLLKVPLLIRGARGKLSAVVRAEKPLPPNAFATYSAVVKGSTLFVGQTVVRPHLPAASGAIAAGRFGYDTRVFNAYTRSVVGGDAGHATALDIYLFDDGHPLLSTSKADVCTTCSYHLAVSGRKMLIQVDDLLSPHATPGASVCRLGFATLTVDGSNPDGVNLQGFVVNSHTSAFDLSVFGFDSQPIAASVMGDAGDSVCNVSSDSAGTFRGYVRPAPKTFTLTVDATHHHGTSTSNVCLRARTAPAQTGVATLTLSGPGGTVSKQVALGSDGLAIAVFPISSFGTYTASAIVGAEGASASYTVDASPGEAFACPAP